MYSTSSSSTLFPPSSRQDDEKIKLQCKLPEQEELTSENQSPSQRLTQEQLNITFPYISRYHIEKYNNVNTL